MFYSFRNKEIFPFFIGFFISFNKQINLSVYHNFPLTFMEMFG